MKRAGIAAAVLIALGIVFFFFTGKGGMPSLSGSSSAPPAGVSPAAPSAPATGPIATRAATEPVEARAMRLPPSQPSPLPSTTGVSPVYLKFLSEEGKLLDSNRVDVTTAEERVKKQVAAMGPAELSYAGQLVISMSGPANERVMAAYTTAQAIATLPSGSEAFRKALEQAGNIIGRTFESGRAEPHSAAELANAQAKSFALMNVDALAERAATDTEAREELIRMGSLAKDPFLQKYILDKVKALPPL